MLPRTGQLAPVESFPAPNINSAEPRKIWNLPDLSFYTHRMAQVLIFFFFSRGCARARSGGLEPG